MLVVNLPYLPSVTKALTKAVDGVSVPLGNSPIVIMSKGAQIVIAN